MNHAALVFAITLVLATIPVDGQPMNPMTALSVGGAAISNFQKGWSGVSDFITGVRSFFGRAGDFASRYGFDNGQVYNASLEYDILQTYQLQELNNVMLQLLHNIGKATSELDKIYTIIVALLAVSSVNALLAIVFFRNQMANKNNNNVNVVHS